MAWNICHISFSYYREPSPLQLSNSKLNCTFFQYTVLHTHPLSHHPNMRFSKLHRMMDQLSMIVTYPPKSTVFWPQTGNIILVSDTCDLDSFDTPTHVWMFCKGFILFWILFIVWNKYKHKLFIFTFLLKTYSSFISDSVMNVKIQIQKSIYALLVWKEDLCYPSSLYHSYSYSFCRFNFYSVLGKRWPRNQV